jgi:hypothetical protein
MLGEIWRNVEYNICFLHYCIPYLVDDVVSYCMAGKVCLKVFFHLRGEGQIEM